MNEDDSSLTRLVENTFSQWESVLDQYHFSLQAHEVGIVEAVSSGIATVSGLLGARLDELIEFPNGLLGIAFNLDAEEIGVILLGDSENVQAGDKVYRLGRILDVPVGEALLGRVVDGLGRPLDDQGDLKTDERWPTERQSRGIMERDPVEVPLQTGIKVIDALIPVGRGQRELIVGDRQIGKTAIAVDTILNQQDHNVICIYCAIGQRGAAVAKVIDRLRQHQAIDYTVVVVAPGESPPGLKYITPYAATSIGEYFRDRGRDVLIIYDDLTQHAWAYRELSLLLRRPPGREAYPGDIFYIHSRLLERATHLRDELGGGSLTAFPIVETQAQNISAYNEPSTGTTYHPRQFQLLPLDLDWLRSLSQRSWQTNQIPLLTMDDEEFLSALIREYLFLYLFRAAATSLASENASRLSSMQSAEKNIQDRIGDLTSEYRRQRQSAITSELLDVVSGFEALSDNRSS